MTTKKKWRLPQDVRSLNPDDLVLVQIKIMLEFMGVSLRASSAMSRAQKSEKLRELVAAEPAKAQTAYDVVVWNKLPEATTEISADVEKLRAHFFGTMSELMSDEALEKLRETMEAAASGLEKRLEEHAKKALTDAAKIHRPMVISEGKTKRIVKGVLPQEFERMVQLAGQRIPTMLVGPAGCGKTYLAAKVAEALGFEFYDQSCSEGVSESIFSGWLLPVSNSGAFSYVESPFIKAYENGGVFLLDEMDAADPNLLTFLNKAIANDSFYLPQRFKKPKVVKHKNFVVIGAANTFGHGADVEYVGRNALDAATLDRFRAGMIHLDYSREVETALVDADVLTWGRRVRTFIYARKSRRIMSTRMLLDLTKMKQNCKWTQEDWERAYFADWSADELAAWRTQL